MDNYYIGAPRTQDTVGLQPLHVHRGMHMPEQHPHTHTQIVINKCIHTHILLFFVYFIPQRVSEVSTLWLGLLPEPNCLYLSSFSPLPGPHHQIALPELSLACRILSHARLSAFARMTAFAKRANCVRAQLMCHSFGGLSFTSPCGSGWS